MVRAAGGAGAVLVTGGEEATGPLASASPAPPPPPACARRCSSATWRGRALPPTSGSPRRPGLHEYLRGRRSAPEILQSLVLAGSASAGAASRWSASSPAGRAAEAGDPARPAELPPRGAKLRGAYDLVVLAGPALDDGEGSLPALAAQADALLAAVAAAGRARGRGWPALRAARRRGDGRSWPPLTGKRRASSCAQRS